MRVAVCGDHTEELYSSWGLTSVLTPLVPQTFAYWGKSENEIYLRSSKRISRSSTSGGGRVGQQLERARRDRGESRPQKYLHRGELLRVALLIQLNEADWSPAVNRRELPDLPEVPSITSAEEKRADLGLLLRFRGPRDGGTQYAQRTGETVSGMKTTAGDSERGHKGRAACTPLVELPLTQTSINSLSLPVSQSPTC
ncbi:hypothetical protein DPMN_027587 [Dreissena polymorpha]|uniref:Uncharacterized protein n=1 Tax=Dreissena polymorpha TaxID=45954 RepID=A0A9D4REI3_DREPO|nr:hypothetical protein DPMN_027587 [Dreissena polymorpha]